MSPALVRTTLLATLLSVATSAQAITPAQAGALPVPANNIVGTWIVLATVAPCGVPVPPTALQAIVVFHAGGTLSDTSSLPLTGVPTPFGLSVRGPAHGTWKYDPLTNRYTYQTRFYWFVNGVYHGYQQVGPQEITLAADGLTYEGVVHAERWVFDPATQTHSKALDFCGSQISERFP